MRDVSHNQKNKKNTVVEKFFIYASGASYDILKKCVSSERIKFAGIGATILMTAIFAFISSSYAFNLIFHSLPVSIGAGLFWGLLIFNLDRFIVSSVTKEDRPFRELLIALPRILIALMISIVIAKPLEVKIFENQINAIIEKSPNNLPSFISSLEALGQLTQTSSTIKWASLLIMLLFFMIEISPIMMRLLTRKGQYDYLLESTLHLEMTIFDKIKAQVSTENFQKAINSLFYLAEQNSDKTLTYRVKKIAIQAKYLDEERKKSTIDEQFADREIAKIKNELIQLANEIKTVGQNEFPEPKMINVNIHEMPVEIIDKALQEFKLQSNR